MRRTKILLGFLLVISCTKESVKKESEIFPQQVLENPEKEKFFAKPLEVGEVFRIYADSNQYQILQVANHEEIQVKPDEVGNKLVTEEISRYNLVDYFAEGMLKVELFPNTGNFYRVRQVRPSGVVEIDKIMSEDITRWQFTFPKQEINPREFKVRYGVRLEKKASRNEVIDILKKHSR